VGDWVMKTVSGLVNRLENAHTASERLDALQELQVPPLLLLFSLFISLYLSASLAASLAFHRLSPNHNQLKLAKKQFRCFSIY
jgi:hypothetical protein